MNPKEGGRYEQLGDETRALIERVERMMGGASAKGVLFAEVTSWQAATERQHNPVGMVSGLEIVDLSFVLCI